jgi:hypothetical protein
MQVAIRHPLSNGRVRSVVARRSVEDAPRMSCGALF